MRLVEIISAATTTLVLGTAIIVGFDSLPRSPLLDVMFLVSIALSVCVGVVILVRRQGLNVPLSAIFAAVMITVLAFVYFLLAWYRGRVEF